MKKARKPDNPHPCKNCGKTIYNPDDERCVACRLARDDAARRAHGPDDHGPGNPNMIINSDMIPDRYHPDEGTRLSYGFELLNESYDGPPCKGEPKYIS